MLQAYDNELRKTLSAEHAALLRATAVRAADGTRSAPLRIRVGESLVRAGLRLAPDARPQDASPAGRAGRRVEIAC